VDNEHAGKKHYGRVAVVKEVEGDEAVLQFDPVGVDRLKLAMLTPVAELANLKELKKLAGLNSLTRGLCRDIMEKVGYDMGDEEGDVVQDEAPSGAHMFALNIAAAFWWMKDCLKLPVDHLDAEQGRPCSRSCSRVRGGVREAAGVQERSTEEETGAEETCSDALQLQVSLEPFVCGQ
jgi:hypothetical protein